MELDCCTYCGDYNQCRDHVRPISYDSVFRHYHYYENGNNIVPCCMQCNTLAGDVFCNNIQEKAEYLERRYFLRYGSCRRIEWTDEELSELDGMLKSYVQGKEFERRLIRWKLDNLQRVSNGFDVIPIHEPSKEEIDKARQEAFDKASKNGI